LERLVEQVTAFEVVQHKVEKIDVVDPQPRLFAGDVFHQETNVVADPNFVFGRVVEDVERDLVADTAATEKVIGCDPRQNLVETVRQLLTHGDTSMQRKTHSSLCFCKYRITCGAMCTDCSLRDFVLARKPAWASV